MGSPSCVGSLLLVESARSGRRYIFAVCFHVFRTSCQLLVGCYERVPIYSALRRLCAVQLRVAHLESRSIAQPQLPFAQSRLGVIATAISDTVSLLQCRQVNIAKHKKPMCGVGEWEECQEDRNGTLT